MSTELSKCIIFTTQKLFPHILVTKLSRELFHANVGQDNDDTFSF